MSLNWGITDLLAVTKLAWDLYHKCFLVAREAPDDFRQLVNELASLQSILRSLRDDVTSDKSFLEKMGENRKEMLERCLSACFDTLRKLERFVVKFRELGIPGDGPQFWRKLKWVFKQGEISGLRSKIMVHSCNLNLCMSSIGNSSLRNLEIKMTSAIEREQATQQQDEADEEDESLAPLAKTKTEPSTSAHMSEDGGINAGLSRAMTGSTLVPANAASVRSPELTPSVSSEGGSELGSPPLSRQRKISTSGKVRQGLTSNPMLGQALPPSPLSSDNTFGDNQKSSRSNRLVSTGEDSQEPAKPPTEQNVDEAVAEAMKKLSMVNNQQRAERAMRLPRQNALHAPNEALKRCFEKQIEEEMKAKSLNTKDWLRMGTWWLMKAQFHMRDIEAPRSPNTRTSYSISGASSQSGNQAYIDLLKASWIMNTFIVKGDSLVVMTSDENKKLLRNLAKGLRSELSKFKPVDVLSDNENFDEQEYDLFETVQPEEEDYDSTTLFGPDPGRYITEELHDAGDEDEFVVFRTFVNAEIGLRRHRVKSAGSPYLLCLSSKDGVSEPRVTLCNQSCSMELVRDFTTDDLQRKPKVPTSHMPNVANMNTDAPYPLDFGNMKTNIAFANEVDFHRFMNIPKRYFDMVKSREPRNLQQATETVLFKRSVELYERITPDTLKLTDSQYRNQSCDLRVLETTSRVGWHTYRRLVVSSSFGEVEPWCTDEFLPLSRVQIKRHDDLPRQALVRWSNCSQEIVGTDGFYNRTYNYIYNDQNPNVAISVYFRNSADASEFESKILTLSVPPIYPPVSPLINTLPIGASEKVIYDISDTGPEARTYKAILLTHTNHNWRYGELFYTFRDLDYIYDHATLTIHFPLVNSVTYISNFCDNTTHRPSPKAPPEFDHCRKEKANFSVNFEDSSSAMSFMSALRPGWNLLFSRRALFLSTRPPPRFGRQPTSKKGPVEVQIWQKQNTQELSLLGRWNSESVDDKWLTLSIDRGQASFPPGSNKADLGASEFRRGRKIDMADLTATEVKENKNSKGNGPVTIFFDRVQDREDFEATVSGKPMSPGGGMQGALGELIMMG